MFGVVLNAIQFLVWPKIFVVAQNILGHVEGQGVLYVAWLRKVEPLGLRIQKLNDHFKIYHKDWIGILLP